MEDQDQISKLFFIKFQVELLSPCILGSGNTDNSDIDFMRDYDGNPFIPGSSIAGVLRSYVSNYETDEDEGTKQLFGRSDDEFSQSAAFVSDGCFINTIPTVLIRDGVSLNKYKISEDKYDHEIIASGESIELKIEVQIRKKHDVSAIKNKLYQIIKGFEQGEIKFGAKTNRGFGTLALKKETLKICCIDFTETEDINQAVESWLNFDWSHIQDNLFDYHELSSEVYKSKTLFTTISTSLDIQYSILIREYSTDPDECDYEHIHAGNKPVIPGTSWAGAIRHYLEKTLNRLSIDGKRVVEDIFGFTNRENFSLKNISLPKENIIDSTKEKKLSRSSFIQIEESPIFESIPILQKRVKIDRYAGGAVDGGFFEEKAQYGGKTELKIRIRKNEFIDTKGIIGILILALKDLSYGILTVGGETAVGRGIFENKNNQFIQIDGNYLDETQEGIYLKAASKFLREGGYISVQN